MIRVLGFCGSPRLGNSLYLLEQALEAVRRRAEELGEEVELDTCSIRGKKLSGCVMCQGCMRDGTCLMRDDFAPLQEKWLAADVVIYSVPVYHMGIPAQLKAFLDRLGNSSFGRYKKLFGEDVVTVPRPMKVIGCISQGIHSSSGWTLNEEGRGALREQYERGEESARVAVDSSRSLAVRALDMAVLLRNGGRNSPQVTTDPKYIAFAERLRDEQL